MAIFASTIFFSKAIPAATRRAETERMPAALISAR